MRKRKPGRCGQAGGQGRGRHPPRPYPESSHYYLAIVPMNVNIRESKKPTVFSLYWSILSYFKNQLPKYNSQVRLLFIFYIFIQKLKVYLSTWEFYFKTMVSYKAGYEGLFLSFSPSSSNSSLLPREEHVRLSPELEPLKSQ